MNKKKSTSAHASVPLLVALVYRADRKCKQYPFETVEQLEQWCARHPYRNERIMLIPIATDAKTGDKTAGNRIAVWARDAGAVVREFLTTKGVQNV